MVLFVRHAWYLALGGQMASTIRRREFIISGRAAGELGRASTRPLSLLPGTLRTARQKLLVFADQKCVVLAICLLVTSELLTSATAAPLPRNALVLDEPDPSSGNSTIFSVTLRATLNTFTPRVAVFGEPLNLGRFTGPDHESILRTYLEQKYSDVGFGVIVVVGASAFDLVRRWRSELWPNVPVVFAAIDEMTAAEFKPDPETTGFRVEPNE